MSLNPGAFLRRRGFDVSQGGDCCEENSLEI